MAGTIGSIINKTLDRIEASQNHPNAANIATQAKGVLGKLKHVHSLISKGREQLSQFKVSQRRNYPARFGNGSPANTAFGGPQPAPSPTGEMPDSLRGAEQAVNDILAQRTGVPTMPMRPAPEVPNGQPASGSASAQSQADTPLSARAALLDRRPFAPTPRPANGLNAITEEISPLSTPSSEHGPATPTEVDPFAGMRGDVDAFIASMAAGTADNFSGRGSIADDISAASQYSTRSSSPDHDTAFNARLQALAPHAEDTAPASAAATPAATPSSEFATRLAHVDAMLDQVKTGAANDFSDSSSLAGDDLSASSKYSTQPSTPDENALFEPIARPGKEPAALGELLNELGLHAEAGQRQPTFESRPAPTGIPQTAEAEYQPVADLFDDYHAQADATPPLSPLTPPAAPEVAVAPMLDSVVGNIPGGFAQHNPSHNPGLTIDINAAQQHSQPNMPSRFSPYSTPASSPTEPVHSPAQMSSAAVTPIVDSPMHNMPLDADTALGSAPLQQQPVRSSPTEYPFPHVDLPPQTAPQSPPIQLNSGKVTPMEPVFEPFGPHDDMDLQATFSPVASNFAAGIRSPSIATPAPFSPLPTRFARPQPQPLQAPAGSAPINLNRTPSGQPFRPPKLTDFIARVDNLSVAFVNKQLSIRDQAGTSLGSLPLPEGKITGVQIDSKDNSLHVKTLDQVFRMPQSAWRNEQHTPTAQDWQTVANMPASPTVTSPVPKSIAEITASHPVHNSDPEGTLASAITASGERIRLQERPEGLFIFQQKSGQNADESLGRPALFSGPNGALPAGMTPKSMTVTEDLVSIQMTNGKEFNASRRLSQNALQFADSSIGFTTDANGRPIQIDLDDIGRDDEFELTPIDPSQAEHAVNAAQANTVQSNSAQSSAEPAASNPSAAAATKSRSTQTPPKQTSSIPQMFAPRTGPTPSIAPAHTEAAAHRDGAQSSSTDTDAKQKLLGSKKARKVFNVLTTGSRTGPNKKSPA